MNLPNKRKTCKDCPYYSGVQCHGHGEFYGDCELLSIIFNHNLSFDYVCSDDTKCHIEQIVLDAEKARKERNKEKTLTNIFTKPLF